MKPAPPFVSTTEPSSLIMAKYAWLVLWMLPLFIGILWGDFLHDDSFAILRKAHSLASGRNLIQDAGANDAGIIFAPLYVALLALLNSIGINLLQAAVIVSALGWGLSAVAVYWTGRAIQRPLAGSMAAVLVATGPMISSSLGLDTSWTIGLAWLSLYFALAGRWQAHTGLLVALLLSHFDGSTIFFVALSWVWQWQVRRRRSLAAGLILLSVTLAWMGAAFWQYGRLPLLSKPALNEVVEGVRALLSESELYAVFVPFAVLGLLALKPRPIWISFVWVLLTIVSSSTTTWSVTAVFVQFVAAVGVDRSGQWLADQQFFRLDRRNLSMGLALFLGVFMVTAQLTSLRHRHQARPREKLQLEREAAAWLREHTATTAIIFASERVGFLAERSLSPKMQETLRSPDTPELLRSLMDYPADFVVTGDGLNYELLTQAVWFLERYRLLMRLPPELTALPSLSIWGYASSDFDQGETQALDVQTEMGVNVVGYRYWPERIQPGDAIHVTVFFQATRAVTTSFSSLIRVVSPADGSPYAQWSEPTPKGLPLTWWRPGQVISTRVALTTTHTMPVGAYQVNLSLFDIALTKAQAMYQNQDPNPLDRVLLGYTAVPMQLEPDQAEQIGAVFDDQIRLSAARIAGQISPGSVATINLYWEALRRPVEDYTVFAHLLDATGQWVAGHDGRPLAGRFPTPAWIPGELVLDTHPISIPHDLVSGSYQFGVGLYLSETGERLPVLDNNSVPQTGRAITLVSFEIP